MIERFSDLQNRLLEHGWFRYDVAPVEEATLSTTMHFIGLALGTHVEGRNGKWIERLVPQEREQVKLPSLSSTHGTGRFPFHMDMAHRVVPCRYIILGCEFAPETSASTILLDKRKLSFTGEEMQCLKNGTFLVKNGRNSFYSSMIDRQQNYLRWDPGCMIPKDEFARLAVRAVEREIDTAVNFNISWRTGSLLVIDNWRMLHGRADCARGNSHRILLRSSIS